MIRGRFFITPHAVRRFIERYYKGITFNEGREILIDLCEESRFVRIIHNHKKNSEKLYRLPRHGCSRARIIVGKPKRNGDKEVVVTVL